MLALRRRLCCLALACVLGCGEEAGLSATDSNPKRTGPLVVALTGSDFAWEIRYAGTDGQLNTADDVETTRNLRLPAHMQISVELLSNDYIYSLALPHCGLKEIAVPDMSHRLEFETKESGEFELLGDQLCGYAHPDLMAKMTVLTKSEFKQWLSTAQVAR